MTARILHLLGSVQAVQPPLHHKVHGTCAGDHVEHVSDGLWGQAFQEHYWCNKPGLR